MRAATRQFLQSEVAELLGLPGSKVIWANQEGYKQAAPFVTLQTFAERAEAMADHLHTKKPEEVELRTPTAFTLEVQYFAKKGTSPVDILSDFVRQLERPTVTDAFQAAGVAYLYAEAVQDVMTLLGNTQQTEPRASVDLHLRYTASVLDAPGIIDTVEVNGKTPKDLNFIVKVITKGESKRGKFRPHL